MGGGSELHHSGYREHSIDSGVKGNAIVDAIQHLEAAREELKRNYREQMALLDRLVAAISGSPPDFVGMPEIRQPSTTSTTASPNSVVDQVRSALADEFRSVAQVAKITGIAESKIRGAIYSTNLKEQLEKRKVLGRSAEFRLRRNDEPIQAIPTRKSMVEAIQQVLIEHADGMKLKEVTKAIEPLCNSVSRNPRAVVFSALTRLKKRGAVEHDESTGIYKIRPI